MFLLVAGVLVVTYAIVAPLVYANKGWNEGGPLAYGQPEATAPLDPAHPLAEIERACAEVGSYTDDDTQYRSEIVSGTPRSSTPAVCGVAGVVQILPFTLPVRGRESGGRRIRLLFEFGFGWIAFLTVSLFLAATGDRLGFTVTDYSCAVSSR